MAKQYTKLRKTGELVEVSGELDPETGRWTGTGKYRYFAGFTFLIDLTNDCTRRCSYCYAKNEGNLEGRMSDDTFNKTLKWIKYIYDVNKIKYNLIIFMGGEPLLDTPRIKLTMRYALESISPVFYGMIITNGDCIEHVDWNDLQDLDFWMQAVHDTSLEENIRRMKIAKDHIQRMQSQTWVIVCSDKNIDRIKDLTYAAVENDYRLRIYRDIYRIKDKSYRDKLSIAYNNVLDILEDYANQGHDIPLDALFDVLNPKYHKGFDGYPVSPYMCGRNYASIRTDGTVSSCIRKKKTFNTRVDEFDISKLKTPEYQWRLSHKRHPDECFECEVRTECQGGCPFDNEITTGSTIGKSIMCDVHKPVILRMQKILNIMKEKRNKFAETKIGTPM